MLQDIKIIASKLYRRSRKDHDEIRHQIGLSAIAAARGRYANITELEQADLKVFSQYGEDGIIDFILDRLGIRKPTFVEIGTEDYSESNTRFLFQRTNTKGLIIDCDPDLETKSRSVLSDYFWKGELHTKSSFVTKDNINSLLTEDQEDWFKSDIFSLDIDGNDYWIMQEIISSCQHKLIILEYNPYFGPTARISTPYQANFNRTKYHHSNLCFGASLGAFTQLLSANNYTFAGSNINNQNGFWVRSDLFHRLGINQPSIEDLESYTQNYCRESRNTAGELSLLSGDSRLIEIQHCDVVNLDMNEKIQKICDIHQRSSNDNS